MGIFDRFKGKRPEQEDASPLNDAAAAAAVSPTLDLTEQTTLPQADAAQGFTLNTEEAARLYNPYEGLYITRC